VLYSVSGLLGTITSTIFLPGVISVGASASVFGLVGAYWADIGLNYCARCDLKDTGFCGLLFGTIPNMLIGLTPWVDNFMHLGGYLTGAAIATLMLPEIRVRATVVNPYDRNAQVPKKVKSTPLGRKRKSRVQQWHRLGDKVMGGGAGFTRAVTEARNDAATRIQAVVRGRLVRRGRGPLHQRLYRRLCGRLNRSQKIVVLCALLILTVFSIGMLSAVSSGSTLEALRTCSFCKSLNCVEITCVQITHPD